MRSKSIYGESADEIREALEHSVTDDFNPTLAVVFLSVKQDREAICTILRNAGMDIIGSTTSGEFVNGYHGEGSVVILLLDIPRDAYVVLFEEFAGKSILSASTQLARRALERFDTPAFIVCGSGVTENGELLDGKPFVRGIVEEVGPHVNIYGGLAGDDLTLSGSWVFTTEGPSNAGIAALVLDEKRFILSGMAISGWNPIGIKRTVTKSEGPWVYTIDDQPALDMYLRYLGEDHIAGGQEHSLLEKIGLLYPFQVEGSDDPVMRTPVMIDENTGALLLDHAVAQGTQFRFSMPPDFNIAENVMEGAKIIRDASQQDAEALLIFSCAGRLSALGPLTHVENEGLSEIWNAPMVGFFTYGEFGMGDGRPQFFSTTCSWVALKEK